jgi:ABC-type lipoprotein release transport system permease subunit
VVSDVETRAAEPATGEAHVLTVPWYWLRTSFARRFTGYLSIVLLIGLVGGIAMGSVIAAQRTSSSYNVFLASTNPSDLDITIGAPNLSNDLSQLPLVKHVGTATLYDGAFPSGKNDRTLFPGPILKGTIITVASLNGEYFSQDKLAVVQGRLANPKKLNEFVVTAIGAKVMGWHVGQSIPMNLFTGPQTSLPAFSTGKLKPTLAVRMKLVGTVTVNTDVVADAVDRYPTFMIFTPAVGKLLNVKGVNYINYALKLEHGARDVPAVEREVINSLPKGTTYSFRATSVVAAQVNKSIEPEAIALGIFGLIAALAALVIASSLIARVLQSDGEDLVVLRALGAPPSMVAGSVLLGIFASILVGSLLAVLVGVSLTPLSPLGPVHSLYPFKGLQFDWPVLGLGFVIAVLVLSVFATYVAWRRAHRNVMQRRLVAPARSRVARVLAEAGLPVTMVAGVRFALEPGRDRDAVPVRAALLGAVLAVTLVVATVTFGSGLNTLISHPALYGWNWNYALTGNGSDIPPQSTHLLDSDPLVSGWSGVGFAPLEIDNQSTPVLLYRTSAKVLPRLLSGHGLTGKRQIILGPTTMQELHKKLGDTVVISYGSPKSAPVYVAPTKLTIVGTAALPAVGDPLSGHPSMGTGGIVSQAMEPLSMRKYLASPYRTLNGPKMVFVRFRRGVSNAAGLASLKSVEAAGNKALYALPNGIGAGDSIEALPVQYPAEIQNYKSIGDTPSVLALGLAAGASVALGLTLTASVRRRRRDLAMLRALGFTGRQLRATIAWQASVAGVSGVVVGVPLGIVLGRWLWSLFARYIGAVPEPTVPVVIVVLVSLCALLLVNIVAALPARFAARVSTAQVLRGE